MQKLTDMSLVGAFRLTTGSLEIPAWNGAHHCPKVNSLFSQLLVAPWKCYWRPLVDRFLTPGCVCSGFFVPPGDSSELDEIHHSVRPFAPRQSDLSYAGTTPSPPAITESTQQTHTHLSHPPPEDPLGPLPDNWEMAYTENGEVYFIE